MNKDVASEQKRRIQLSQHGKQCRLEWKQDKSDEDRQDDEDVAVLGKGDITYSSA